MSRSMKGLPPSPVGMSQPGIQVKPPPPPAPMGPVSRPPLAAPRPTAPAPRFARPVGGRGFPTR